MRKLSLTGENKPRLRSKVEPCEDQPAYRRKRTRGKKKKTKATKLTNGVVKDDAMIQRLYVANLSFDSTEDMIREFFSDIGTITIVKMPVHRCTMRCHEVMVAEAKQRLLSKGLRRKPKVEEVEPCPRSGRFQGFAFVTVAKLKDGLTLERAADTKCGATFRGRVLHVTVADPPRSSRAPMAAEEKVSS